MNPSNHQNTTPRRRTAPDRGAIFAAIMRAVDDAARPVLAAALVAFWRGVLALAATRTGDTIAAAEKELHRGTETLDGAFAACVAAWWPDGGANAVAAVAGRLEPELAPWCADVARDALAAVESHTQAAARPFAEELLARAAAEECAPLALGAAQVFAAMSPDERAAATMTALAALHEQAATVLRGALERDEGLDRGTVESFADDARDIAATVVKGGHALLDAAEALTTREAR